MLIYQSMNDFIIVTVDEVLLLICRSCALPSRLISVRLEESSMTTCSPVRVCQSSGNAASRGTTRTRPVTLYRVNILLNRLRNANDGCRPSWICFRSACASAETCCFVLESGCCSTRNACFRCFSHLVEVLLDAVVCGLSGDHMHGGSANQIAALLEPKWLSEGDRLH